MSRIDLKFILDEIYQKSDPRRLFQKLELTERGPRYSGQCPQCGEKSLYVLKYDPRYPGLKARCNRLNHCGFAVSAWDYLRDVEGVPPDLVLKTLAERAGVDLGRLRGEAQGPGAAEAWQRRERKAHIFEAFWTWAAERMQTESAVAGSEAARTRDFLHARGYDDATIGEMGLVFLPPPGETRAWLLAQKLAEPAELQGAPYLDRAYERRNAAGERIYTLAIPYPDCGSLVARATLNGEALPDDAPKYRYPRGLKLDAPAFLRAVDRRRPVVVVEGFLDALLARARMARDSARPASTDGPDLALLGQLIASGTNRLNGQQIAALQGAGVRELILCFDRDASAGADGTRATLDRLAEAGTFFPRVLRLPEALGCKDPDEVMAHHGAEALAELLAHDTQSEASFRAEALLQQTGGGAERTLAALAEAVEAEAGRPARALMLRELSTRVAEGLGLGVDDLAARMEPFRRRAALRRRSEALQTATREVQVELLDAGQTAPDAEGLARAEAALRTGLQRADMLARESGGELPQPLSLAAYRAHLADRPDTVASPFAALDTAASIHPGRITLVAARPSHGKTTFMLNLLVHWLKTYPERRFVFFSYDGPREQLLSQLVSRLTRRYALREIEDALCRDASLSDHPEAKELQAHTEAALRWLHGQGAEERLFLIDRPLSAHEMCRCVEQIGADGPLGAVMVDYIQQVRPGEGKRLDTRQREVGYVSRVLQGLAQETGVPVVAAAQLNRTSEGYGGTDRPRLWQLREAGDLEQDATTVYGLYNHHQAAAESQPLEEANSATAGAGALEGNLGDATWRAWNGGPVLNSGASNGNGNGKGRGRRGSKSPAAHGQSSAVSAATAALDAPATAQMRWVVPNALRSVALDVEVLKAKHGRTHTRVKLTYDMVANFITDGRSDGGAEVST